mmetsp:Transcript_15073/g.36449  ORF Transcript_15073/g.36449 Transcript_15073/m.36449 type:complete len:226 (-) Transcript_15073:1702-2379(-)
MSKGRHMSLMRLEGTTEALIVRRFASLRPERAPRATRSTPVSLSSAEITFCISSIVETNTSNRARPVPAMSFLRTTPPMLTPTDPMARDIDASIPGASVHSTSTSTARGGGGDDESHATPMTRWASDSSRISHVAPCTLMPEPRVMMPLMCSPCRGAHCLQNWISILRCPPTSTPSLSSFSSPSWFDMIAALASPMTRSASVSASHPDRESAKNAVRKSCTVTWP